MTFAVDYRRIVVPRLRHAARLQAIAIATGSTGFSEALATILRLAYRFGAAHLPADIRDALEDAIADWLLAQLELVLPLWDEAEERAARAAADIDRFEAEFRKTLA